MLRVQEILLYKCIKCDSGYVFISVIGFDFDDQLPISCLQFGLDIFACDDGFVFWRSFVGNAVWHRLEFNQLGNMTENSRGKTYFESDAKEERYGESSYTAPVESAMDGRFEDIVRHIKAINMSLLVDRADWSPRLWENQNFVFGVQDLQCPLHEYQAPANGLWSTRFGEVSFGDGVIKNTDVHSSLRKRLRPSLKSFVEVACTVNYRSTGRWSFLLDIIIDLTCLYMLICMFDVSGYVIETNY